MDGFKQLVDETSNIKDEVVRCHTNLKNKLSRKGVQISDTDKMSELIEKIDEVNSNLPNWVISSKTDYWLDAKNMPTIRTSLTSSSVNGKIYCIGGYGISNDELNINECYDTNTNRWTTKANMPTARANLSSSSVNGKIYCIGGELGGSFGSGILSKNECYDTATDVWTTKANMPTARDYFSSSVVNNKIYCIGGERKGDVYKPIVKNECYDTSTNTWTTKANMPTATYMLTSNSVNGKIYCIGGEDNTDAGQANINQCYDTKTNTWTTKMSMISGAKELVSGRIKDNIYCIGGRQGNDGYINKNQCYNTSTNTWTTKANMPTARARLTSSSVGNNIYCIAGNNTGKIANNECYIV